MKRKLYIVCVLMATICLQLCMSGISYSEGVSNSADSAIIMDVKTGRILYEKNMMEKRPMASTTKIMTALLALENSNLNTIVKIPNAAVGTEGSSIYVQPGEKIKMEDLLYGLMLRSGNDAAVSIANHISGSVEEFSELMNKRAKEIGAQNTNFMNPHGLHHKEHYTTAYDLALISRKALLNENFKKIVQTKLWTAEREGFKYFYNKNKTLSQFEGGDGVKTGYTKAAGRCLVTSATRNGMQLVCVVLDDPNWFEDSYRLLNYAFDTYEPYVVIEKDISLKRTAVKNGKKMDTGIISKESIIIPVKEDEKNKVLTVIEIKEELNAPVKRGSAIGKAKTYLDGKLIHTTELYTREDIEAKDFKDKVLDFIKK